MATLNPVLSPSKPSGWKGYFSPWLDTLCLGGLTFVVLIPFLVPGWVPFPESTPVLSTLAFWGSILVNYPHYAATYYRVYRDTSEIRRYGLETIGVPVALLILGGLSFALPTTIAPWYCFGYVLFSGYHYAGQAYGIGLIFCKKAGIELPPFQKLCLWLPVYFVYLYPTIRGNTVGETPLVFFGVTMPQLNLPAELATGTLWIFYGSLALYLGLWAFIHGVKKQRIPWIVHIVVGAQVVWYTFGSAMPGFFTFVPFFHCLQYLVITSYFHFKETVPPAELADHWNSRSYLSSMPFRRYYLILILVGSALFLLTPVMITAQGWTETALANAVVLSFINMHHFILDGAIWKLRQPDLAGPLIS